MENIVITNITKVSLNSYKIEFTSNFDLSDLYYEISMDGISFGPSISLPSFSSPQIVDIENVVDFYLRLKSNFTPYSRIHTNPFTETFN
jgi:hypothetical protein